MAMVLLAVVREAKHTPPPLSLPSPHNSRAPTGREGEEQQVEEEKPQGHAYGKARSRNATTNNRRRYGPLHLMVSASSPEGGGGGGGGGGGLGGTALQQPQSSSGMAAPPGGSGSVSSAGGAGSAAAAGAGTNGAAAAPASAAGLEDPSKKIRKPYTITKSRESWTEQEHDKFLEALQLFDRDWKKIEAFVGSKTVIQIRSHAQKYFLKVQKNGTSEHVPPPRPKRKAAHPYPQKASKNAPPLSQTTMPYQASSCLIEPGYAVRADSSSMIRTSTSGAAVVSWTQTSTSPSNTTHTMKDDVGVSGSLPVNNCCSSTESPQGTWTTSETTDKVNHIPSHRVMPDFSQVYRFIGSVFDPNTSGHLERLKEMDPIDVETVLLLMRNLSVNLTSPELEDHRRLLSSYDIDSEEARSNDANIFQNEVTGTAIRLKTE